MGSDSKPPLKVLVVTPLGTGGMGGIDRIMDSVAERLARKAPTDLQVTYGVTRGQGHIVWSPFLVFTLLTRVVVRKLTRRGPDVVHVNLSSQGSTLRKLIITRFLRFLGIPYLIHLHGSGFRPYWDGASASLSAQIHAMFAHATTTIVLGEAWREYIEARVPEIVDRLVILPNATPRPATTRLSRLAGGEKPFPTVLFLGHVGPRKGIPQLVEALTNLRDVLGWRAILAGNGDVEGTMAVVRKNGIADRVTMPGWVGPDDVAKLLESSDILVLPSFEENLPMSVIEGMASGLAVVTTPVGATTDIIEDGVTGLLVQPGDTAALTVAIGKLIADPVLRQNLGAAAVAFHREHLEMDAYADRLVDLWRDAYISHRDAAKMRAAIAH
jgi:glycosyltransferase involved in cell wall biosynthesis